MGFRRSFLPSAGARRAIPIVAVTLLSLPASAQAALASYSFSGHITNGPAKAVLGINIGDSFSGTLTYDTKTNLLAVFGGVSIYGQSKVVPPSGMILDVDGQDFSTPAGQAWSIGVSNNDAPGIDGIAFSHNFPIAPNPDLPGTTSISLIVQLIDSTQSVFSDESLPATLSPDDFDQKTLRIVTSSIVVGSGYTGTIESFTLVPEPATIGLAASVGPLLGGYALLSRRFRFSRAS